MEAVAAVRQSCRLANPISPFLSAPKRLNNRVHDSFPVGPDHRSDDHTNYRPGFPRCLIKLREGPGFWRLNSASATEFSSVSRQKNVAPRDDCLI